MLTILTDENKLLRKKSKRVSKIDNSIKELANSLIHTMINNCGVGLAAPQCGILKRIIIVLINDTPTALVNPEITNTYTQKEVGKEGCLSIPNKYLEKERYSKIDVKYRNIDGYPCSGTYEGLVSRIIQHEIDHLDGILMID
jgi:peptide deformylase